MRYTRSVLKKLESYLCHLNYRVRYEKGAFQSASCRVYEHHTIIINKYLSVDERIETLLYFCQQKKLSLPKEYASLSTTLRKK